MKLNRERIGALIAFLILLLGLKEVVLGFVSPVKGIQRPDIKFPMSRREILYRKPRTFTEEGEPSRNPFSFSEGWQRVDSAPAAFPLLPPPPRLLPSMGDGPTALEAGFLYQDRPPAEVAAEAGGEEEGK
jgi:hypothetical protein